MKNTQSINYQLIKLNKTKLTSTNKRLKANNSVKVY